MLFCSCVSTKFSERDMPIFDVQAYKGSIKYAEVNYRMLGLDSALQLTNTKIYFGKKTWKIVL